MRPSSDVHPTSSARGLRRGGHLITVISPHFDDAPLSLGQSLRDGRLSRHQVRVRVAFGRTNWTGWVHPTPERTAYVSAWRRMEETLASVVFSYVWTAANWPEVILRTEQLTPDEILDGSSDLSLEPLVGELSRWLSAVRRAPQHKGSSDGVPELLLVPAGLGGHLDHRIVAAAAVAVTQRSGAPIGFYEDRPYSAYLSDEEKARHMTTFGLDLRPVQTSPQVKRSTQVISRLCYPSQMSPYFREAMDLDRQVNAVEHVWFPAGETPDWF